MLKPFITLVSKSEDTVRLTAILTKLYERKAETTLAVFDERLGTSIMDTFHMVFSSGWTINGGVQREHFYNDVRAQMTAIVITRLSELED